LHAFALESRKRIVMAAENAKVVWHGPIKRTRTRGVAMAGSDPHVWCPHALCFDRYVALSLIRTECSRCRPASLCIKACTTAITLFSEESFNQSIKTRKEIRSSQLTTCPLLSIPFCIFHGHRLLVICRDLLFVAICCTAVSVLYAFHRTI
jgi:hypothetical protein